MIRPLSRALAAVVLVGLSFSCASLPTDPGFQEIQDAVRRRSGYEVTWNRQAVQEEMARQKVSALLQKELTAEDAVAIALLNNRRLQATLEELGVARADQIQAGLIANPVLGAEVRFPYKPFEISVVQALVRVFQHPARRRQAAVVFESAKLRVTNAVLDLVAETRAAFYDVQATEQKTAMRRTAVEAARASAELALRQRDAGNVSDLDLENEQALFAQAKLDLARSEAQVLAGRERLNTLMGLWGADTSWKPAPNLPGLPSADPGPEGLESLAVSQRLDLLAARQDVEAAARAVPLARAEAIGEITAGIHREREPEGTKTTGPDITVPLPFSNRGRAARARAEAVLRQAQQRYAALAVEIRSEVRAARDRMATARAATEYYQDVILPRRERIVAISQRHYNYMLLSPFLLILARQNEVLAQAESIEALREYWVARSDLQRALGASLEAGPSVAPPSAPAEPSKEPEGAHEPPSGDHGGDGR